MIELPCVLKGGRGRHRRRVGRLRYCARAEVKSDGSGEIFVIQHAVGVLP